MNIKQLIDVFSKASKRTDPWAFNKLSNTQKEMVLKKAIKDTKFAPNEPIEASNKKLQQNIANRLNDAETMDYIRNYNSKNLLDAQASKFLENNADKISKDLEDYTIIPTDYEDKYNRVNLSKFVDEDEYELPQSNALDQLLYNEGIENINRGTTDDELLEAINEQRKASPNNAWKNTQEYKYSPTTTYSKKQSDPYVSQYGNQYLPLEYFKENINIPNETANQRYINKLLDEFNEYNFEKLYNKFDEKDPLIENIDPYTGLKQNTESTDDSFLQNEIKRRLYRNLHQKSMDPEVLKELYKSK